MQPRFFNWFSSFATRFCNDITVFCMFSATMFLKPCWMRDWKLAYANTKTDPCIHGIDASRYSSVCLSLSV